MVYKFFDKKTKGGGLTCTNKSMSPNDQLAEEQHKPIIRKFEKRRVYASYRDAIWGADLADDQLLSKFNKGFRFLLCFIDRFSKYAWVALLKDKKGLSIGNTFKKILKDPNNRKLNKIWVVNLI